MSDAIIVGIVAAFPPTVVAIAGLIRGMATAGDVKKQEVVLGQVHLAVNSNMAAAVATIRDGAAEIAALKAAAVKEIQDQMASLKADLAARDARTNGDYYPPPRRRRRPRKPPL